MIFGILFFLFYILSFVLISSLQFTGIIYAIASLFRKDIRLKEVFGNPKVAVIVACRNEKEVVIRTINHLLTLTYKNKEVIVGDDSDNGTYELILKTFGLVPKLYKETEKDGKIYLAKNKNLTVIHREKNFGFKAGNLKLCHEYIEDNNVPFYSLFDADWLPDQNFIEKVLPYFYTFENAGCVQFKRLLPQKVSNFFTRVTSLSPETAYQVDLPGRANLRSFVLFCGSSGMFKTKAVTESGGWQPGNLTEDIDLSLRLYLNGYKIYFDRKTRSYGEETPNHFSNFIKQQARWQRGTLDSAREYLLPAIFSKKLPVNEKIGLIYQSLIFFPYLLVFVFILFNIVVDILLFHGLLPASLYISFGKTGKLFYWLAFVMFFFDMFKLGVSVLQRKNNKKDILLVPLTTLVYWALIPSGFWANIKSLFNVKEGWFLTPKSKIKKVNKSYSQRICYLVLFVIIYFYENTPPLAAVG